MKTRSKVFLLLFAFFLAAFCVVWLRESGRLAGEIQGRKPHVDTQGVNASNAPKIPQTTPAPVTGGNNPSALPTAAVANAQPSTLAGSAAATAADGQIRPGTLKQIAALEQDKA